MKTCVVSVFPACGRNYTYYNQNKILIRKDLFKEKSSCTILNCNDRYPKSIKTIEKAIGIVDFIFFEQNDVLLKTLKSIGIPVVMVVPNNSSMIEERERVLIKNQWLGRIVNSSSDSDDLSRIIRVFLDNYEDWTNILTIRENYSPADIFKLSQGEYLADILEKLYWKKENNANTSITSI